MEFSLAWWDNKCWPTVSLFQSNREQMSHNVKEEVEVKTEIESIFFPAELDYKKEDQQVK